MRRRTAASNRRFLFPRHIRELFRNLHRGGFRLGHFKFGLARRRRGGWPRFTPRGNPGLQSMMFGGLLVAAFHVEQRKIGVNQLFFRLKFFGFVAFGNRGCEVSFAVISHSNGKLRIEVARIFTKDRLKLRDGGIVVVRAEVVHRVVVLILKALHKFFDNQRYRTIVKPAQAWTLLCT
jgi:hypothetical protein